MYFSYVRMLTPRISDQTASEWFDPTACVCYEYIWNDPFYSFDRLRFITRKVSAPVAFKYFSISLAVHKNRHTCLAETV
jgi:hypothetical protein